MTKLSIRNCRSISEKISLPCELSFHRYPIEGDKVRFGLNRNGDKGNGSSIGASKSTPKNPRLSIPFDNRWLHGRFRSRARRPQLGNLLKEGRFEKLSPVTKRYKWSLVNFSRYVLPRYIVRSNEMRSRKKINSTKPGMEIAWKRRFELKFSSILEKNENNVWTLLRPYDARKLFDEALPL